MVICRLVLSSPSHEGALMAFHFTKITVARRAMAMAKKAGYVVEEQSFDLHDFYEPEEVVKILAEFLPHQPRRTE